MAKLHDFFNAYSRALGLEPRDKLTAYGQRGGFAVMAKLTHVEKKGVAILRARFTPDQPLPASLRFGPALQGLLDARRAGLSLERGSAQLTLPEFTTRAAAGEAVPATEAFLAGLAGAGLSAGPACHYCGGTQEVQTVCNGQTVGQICAACQYQQAHALAEERRFHPRSLAPLLGMLPVATLGVAALWCLWWVGVDALFEWRHGHMTLPVKLSSLAVILVGAGLALPVRSLNRVRQKGYWLAGLAGLACGLSGAALGEGFLALERLWRAGAGLRAADAARVAWLAAADGSGLFLFLRGLCLATLLVVAFLIAKPSKPAYKL